MVEDGDVLAEGRLGGEGHATALQLFVARLVHGGHVTLQVVASVCDVSAVRAREQLPAERVTDEHCKFQTVSGEIGRFRVGNGALHHGFIGRLELEHAHAVDFFRGEVGRE